MNLQQAVYETVTLPLSYGCKLAVIVCTRGRLSRNGKPRGCRVWLVGLVLVRAGGRTGYVGCVGSQTKVFANSGKLSLCFYTLQSNFFI